MKVRELIEKLQEHDPELQVVAVEDSTLFTAVRVETEVASGLRFWPPRPSLNEAKVLYLKIDN